MKVVHIVEAFGGGIYTYFKDLSFYFGDEKINNNIHTTVIYSENRKTIKPENIDGRFSAGISMVELHMVRDISPVQDFKSMLNIIRELRKINPDVIHLHSTKAGLLGRFAQLFLFRRKKIFYSPHGYSFLRTDISAFSKKAYWIIEKSLQLIFGGTTIACGDTEYEIATAIGKSYLVRNGIDIDEVRQCFAKHHNAVLTIGIVGRITYARNPKLFNDIALKFPDFQFIWIGDGELKHLITAPNITVTGWLVDREILLKQLNDIDVYLQTSLWEGLPIAVLEAMAMGKPIIATNVIGNKDVVSHNENGFLFDDINELDAHLYVLQEESMRLAFGEKSLARCRLLFDKNKNLNDLLSVYHNG